MTRNELAKRLAAVVPGCDMFPLADLLIEGGFKVDDPAPTPPTPKAKTRGEEVAEQAIELFLDNSLVLKKWVNHPGYSYVVSHGTNADAVAAARKWFAAIIDSERADAGKYAPVNPEHATVAESNRRVEEARAKGAKGELEACIKIMEETNRPMAATALRATRGEQQQENK